MCIIDETFAVAKRKCKKKIQAYKELIQLPAPSWLLLAQLVRVLHWYRRGQGFESCTRLNFF